MGKASVTVGAAVVLAADVAELFGLDANVIYRVCDVRGAGRDPQWTIAPELGNAVDASRALHVWREDVRVVA